MHFQMGLAVSPKETERLRVLVEIVSFKPVIQRHFRDFRANIETYVFRIGALTRTSPFYLWSSVLQFFRHINSNFQKRIAYHLNVTISSINNDV